MRAALVASCLRGAFPPVDLRAVCLVRAMMRVVRCGAVLRSTEVTATNNAKTGMNSVK